jgi:hypothetical protein
MDSRHVGPLEKFCIQPIVTALMTWHRVEEGRIFLSFFFASKAYKQITVIVSDPKTTGSMRDD